MLCLITITCVLLPNKQFCFQLSKTGGREKKIKFLPSISSDSPFNTVFEGTEGMGTAWDTELWGFHSQKKLPKAPSLSAEQGMFTWRHLRENPPPAAAHPLNPDINRKCHIGISVPKKVAFLVAFM